MTYLPLPWSLPILADYDGGHLGWLQVVTEGHTGHRYHTGLGPLKKPQELTNCQHQPASVSDCSCATLMEMQVRKVRGNT
jgi:hypothetical protein